MEAAGIEPASEASRLPSGLRRICLYNRLRLGATMGRARSANPNLVIAAVSATLR